MTVKEYLEQYEIIVRDIAIKKSELSRIEDCLTNTAAHYGEKIGCSGNRNTSQREEQLCEASDLQVEIQQKIDVLKEMQQQIISTINQLDEPELRESLYMRYILGYKWPKIANQLFITVDACYKRHRRAINALKTYEPFEKWEIS